jgi:hypothetical protein
MPPAAGRLGGEGKGVGVGAEVGLGVGVWRGERDGVGLAVGSPQAASSMALTALSTTTIERRLTKAVES